MLDVLYSLFSSVFFCLLLESSDYVAEAPEVVYHRVFLVYYLLGIAELPMERIFRRDALDTRNACSIYKLSFEVHLIVQLSAAVRSFYRAVFNYEHVRSLHFKHLSGLQCIFSTVSLETAPTVET